MDGAAGTDDGPQSGQVVGEGVPERLRVRLPGHVEQKSFGGAEEVDVEHQHQFRGGEFLRIGEEAAGEHLERQVPGVLRETVLMASECEPKANTYPPVNQAFKAASYNPSAADNDAVTVTFKQAVKATDALRTGAYAKTLTFTLSTTSP